MSFCRQGARGGRGLWVCMWLWGGENGRCGKYVWSDCVCMEGGGVGVSVSVCECECGCECGCVGVCVCVWV